MTQLISKSREIYEISNLSIDSFVFLPLTVQKTWASKIVSIDQWDRESSFEVFIYNYDFVVIAALFVLNKPDYKVKTLSKMMIISSSLKVL